MLEYTVHVHNTSGEKTAEITTPSLNEALRHQADIRANGCEGIITADETPFYNEPSTRDTIIEAAKNVKAVDVLGVIAIFVATFAFLSIGG